LTRRWRKPGHRVSVNGTRFWNPRPQDPSQEICMKRLALVAAVLAVAACAKNDNANKDTTTPAAAPAAVPATDSMARMDSARKADSVRADSVRKADSAKAASKTKGATKRPTKTP